MQALQQLLVGEVCNPKVPEDMLQCSLSSTAHTVDSVCCQLSGPFVSLCGVAAFCQREQRASVTEFLGTHTWCVLNPYPVPKKSKIIWTKISGTLVKCIDGGYAITMYNLIMFSKQVNYNYFHKLVDEYSRLFFQQAIIMGGIM